MLNEDKAYPKVTMSLPVKKVPQRVASVTHKMRQASKIGKVHLHTVLPPVKLDLYINELLWRYQYLGCASKHKIFQLYISSVYDILMQKSSKMVLLGKELGQNR